MADRPATDPAEATAQVENIAENSATAAQAGNATAEADPAEALGREVVDLKDKLLRTLAEMENLRRRTDREVKDAQVYGIARFARDVLGVADNMQRALAALDAELREKADSAVKTLLDGVELTERELLKVLERHGVRKFEPQGEKFDPNLHQAMYEVADPSVPAGNVVQVVQPGYMIGDRMLRPALVAVSKGGGKAVQEAANENAQAGRVGGTDSGN